MTTAKQKEEFNTSQLNWKTHKHEERRNKNGRKKIKNGNWINVNANVECECWMWMYVWMNWMSEWFEWMMWITSEWNRLQFHTWEIGHWCVLWKIHAFVLILAQSGCYFHATFWVLLNDIPASNPLKGNHWICETTKFWLSIIKLTVKCESFVWTKQNVKRWKPDSQWNNLSSLLQANFITTANAFHLNI